MRAVCRVASYEIVAVLSPQKGDKEGLAAFAEILMRHSVQVSREEKWGEKKLPHPKHKEITTGFFVYKKCKILPKKVAEISKDIKLDAHIMHFMFRRLK